MDEKMGWLSNVSNSSRSSLTLGSVVAISISIASICSCKTIVGISSSAASATAAAVVVVSVVGGGAVAAAAALGQDGDGI